MSMAATSGVAWENMDKVLRSAERGEQGEVNNSLAMVFDVIRVLLRLLDSVVLFLSQAGTASATLSYFSCQSDRHALTSF